MFTARIHLLSCLVALTLVACGNSDNSTTSQNSDDGSVQLYGAKVATSASNLPTCDSTQVGQLFYVLADEEFQFCSSEGYQSIDLRGSTGANGADGENGTNGTNGTNGADGEDGADGSSCSVIENANGSKTILCEDGTTATVNDGASCTVADNGNGSYDLTCSGTTVTVRDGRDGVDGINGINGINGVNGTNGTSCTATQIAEGLQVSCGGTPVDTIVDGRDGVDGINGINGVNGTNGTSCTATQIAEGLQVSCGGIPVDTIVDGQDGVDGTNGINGTSFHSGVGIPASILGANGDTYLDTYRTAYYLKISGNWVLQSFDVARSFQDSRDGHLYKKVTIGTQTWMAENLAYLPSVNASNDASPSVAKYYVYNYNGTVVATAKASSYYTSYGVLYNWTAAMGVCPTGWHLPSSAEWTTLETYVGGASTAGTKLKSVSGWTVGGDTETDAYGFSALPSGYYYGSDFNYAVNYGYWWSATESDATYAYIRYMSYSNANVYSGNGNKYNGFSVRCLQD